MSQKHQKKQFKTKSGNIKSQYELPERVKYLINHSRIDEALEELCNTKGKNTDEERFFNVKRAHLATQLGKYIMAETFIALAKEGSKNYFYFQALNAETELAIKIGDYDRGRKCCEEAQLYGGADNRRTNLSLGKVLEAQGDYASAIRNYQVAANASNNFTIQKEANYCLGTLSYALGDFKIAEPALKEAIRPGKISAPIYIRLASIYLKQGRCQDALTLVESLKNNNGQLEIDRLSIVPLLVAKQQGTALPARTSKSYNRNQIIEYRQKEALEHIKAKHSSTKETRGCFVPEIDIDQLFVDVKLQMTEDNMINEDVLDVYEIDYPAAGYDLDDNLVNSIRIIAVPGTKDILTMYPSGKSKVRKQGSMQTQVAEAKQKSKMTDKFNTRFAAYKARQQ